ncbi:unnamed protein product [Phaeothamnion confervicola]
MAKGKKGAVAGAGGGGDENEQKLQAILLADSFNSHFRPVSYEVPKVLCPLVNVPMIDYTLEFLASGGVQELFVFCTSHAATVQEYLDGSKWSKHLEIRCISSTNCASEGDALRELDQMGLVHSDPFVLVMGDVISNLDLQAVVERHKEGRMADSSRIMTLSMAEVGHNSSLCPLLTDLVVATNAATGQILLYSDDFEKDAATIALEVLEEHAEVEIRSDLLDCRIDVCSPEVLLLVSDNFDYQASHFQWDLRKHFVANEVVNYEMGNKIVAHILPPQGSEYAVRVDDFRLYHAVSRDLIRRWVYPHVPDNGSTGGAATNYAYQRKCIYREPGVTAPRSVRLGDGVVLGAGVRLGEGAAVARSVVGRGCRVGPDAVVHDSYLWEGAMVGEGAAVHCSVLAAGVTVGSGAVVSRGCVLGPGVTVGAGVVLPEFTRATCWRDEEDDDDAGAWSDVPIRAGTWGGGGGSGGNPASAAAAAAAAAAAGTLGPDGVGRVWDRENDSDDEVWGDDDEKANGDWRQATGGRLQCQSIGCWEAEDWRRRLWREVQEDKNEPENGGYAGDDGEFDDSGIDIDGATADAFYKEVKDMVAEGHSPDNVLLEIKGHKFAQNRTFAECVRPAVVAILDRAGCGDPALAADTARLVAALKRELDRWGPLLRKLAIESENGGQPTLVEAVEAYAMAPGSAGAALSKAFRFCLQLLYDGELVSEEQFRAWAAARRAAAQGAAARRLFDGEATQAFVTWLEEEEEESGSEDDDGDDDGNGSDER